MESVEQKKLIENIAEKYNVSEAEVRKAVYSQFKFIAKQAMPNLKTVRLPFFGVFTVDERKRKKIKERINELNRKNGTTKDQ